MTINNKIDGWTKELPTTPGHYVWKDGGVINKKTAFIYFKYGRNTTDGLVINFEGTVDGAMGKDEEFLSNTENREWLKIS